MLPYLLLLGFLGLVFGSFCNAYIYRYISKDSVWKGRSRCPHCEHELGAKDLIPVLSFLILRGRCRYCRKPIAWQYPLVEGATALLFAGVGLFSGPFHESLPYLIPLGIYLYLALVSVIVSVVDIRIQIIPDRVILPSMVVVALLHLVQVYFGLITIGDCWVLLASAIGGGGALWLLAELSERIVHKDTMGGGDIKLTFLIGLLVGWPGVLVSLITAFWAGAIVGVVLLSVGARSMADRIPFGPYLVLGGIVGLVYGQSVLRLLIPR